MPRVPLLSPPVPSALLLAALTLGCAAPAPHAPEAAPPKPAHALRPDGPAGLPPVAVLHDEPTPPETTDEPLPNDAPALNVAELHLSLDDMSLPLPPGRSLVHIDIQPERFVSLLVLGDPDALLGFDIIGPSELFYLRTHRAGDEDGLLPRALSFRSPPDAASLTLLVDVKTPVQITRSETPVLDEAALLALSPLSLAQRRKKEKPTLPLIGLPLPLSRDDGYLLLSPARYHFMRIDAAEVLLAALRQTRRRFRRTPLGIADISQWNGQRPATDIGAPRHISHQGGRDVDIALPATDDEPSTVRAHCTGVLPEPDVYVCQPGTVRGLDSLRLAYFLGLLLDGPPGGMIERVFMDQVYIQEMRRAAETLKERRWIKDVGFEGLFDDRLVRASPWHVDHFHVRFTGKAGKATF